MTEIVGPKAITVGRLACTLCDTTCGRFPYWLMYNGEKEPKVVCRTCYRTAMCIERLKIAGAFSFKEAGQ